MQKKKSVALAAFIFTVVFAVQASRMDEITLVMIPREDSVVRVGMDLANRYPTLLISYRLGTDGAVSLHGWTGTEWVNVSSDAYKAGAFFNNGPTDAVLVEKEGQPFPDALLPAESWCPSIHKVATVDTRPLLHLIGQHYNFKYSDWKWFASNYKMAIEDINPEGLNVAWYNKPMGEHLRKKTVVVGTSDLEYWSVVRLPQSETVEVLAPLVTNDMPVVEDVQPASDTEQQPAGLDGEDPLTNSIPDAVVLGAGDAAAEVEDEPASSDGESTETENTTVVE